MKNDPRTNEAKSTFDARASAHEFLLTCDDQAWCGEFPENDPDLVASVSVRELSGLLAKVVAEVQRVDKASVTIGDEVEVSNGPMLGGTDFYFVTSLRLCGDGRVQCGFAKANTSLMSAPEGAILRRTGKRWTDEERAKIVAYEKDLDNPRIDDRERFAAVCISYAEKLEAEEIDPATPFANQARMDRAQGARRCAAMIRACKPNDTRTGDALSAATVAVADVWDALNEQDRRGDDQRSSNPEPDRGVLINRLATMGMRLTALRAELPEVEKQARKTPRKDMHAERAKVEAAKARVEPMRAEIAQLAADYSTLHSELIRLGAYPGSAPIFVDDPRTFQVRTPEEFESDRNANACDLVSAWLKTAPGYVPEHVYESLAKYLEKVVTEQRTDYPTVEALKARVLELETAIGVSAPTVCKAFLAMIPAGAAHDIDRNFAKAVLERLEKAMARRNDQDSANPEGK